ncbi:hypothetical protein CEXT_558571, partial [Caerostris extrusa]
LSFSLLREKTPLKIPSPFMPIAETSTSADTRDTSPAEKGKLCLPRKEDFLEMTPLKILSPFMPKVETPTSVDTTPLKIPSPSMPKVETSTSADTRDTSPAEKGELCLPTERYLSSISRK